LVLQDAAVDYGIESAATAGSADRVLISLGMKAVARSQPVSIAPDGRRDQTRRRLILSRASAVGIIAVAALAVAAIAILRRQPDMPAFIQDPRLTEQVRLAAEMVTQRGTIIIPGGERILNGSSPVYRSGFPVMTDSLSMALSALYSAHHADTNSSETAFWLLAGYVATGQMETAREFETSIRDRFPGDARIVNLRAVLSYFSGDYDNAEKLLTVLIQSKPNDLTARINCGVILADQGRISDARMHLEHVLDRFDGTPHARRARLLLNTLNGSMGKF
jgi:tetratricopeptide (TPR) repeat protein